MRLTDGEADRLLMLLGMDWDARLKVQYRTATAPYAFVATCPGCRQQVNVIDGEPCPACGRRLEALILEPLDEVITKAELEDWE